MIFSKVCINFSPVLQGDGRVGGEVGRVGGEVGRVGRGGGEGGGKKPQVKTRGDQLPTDGPDHTTRPKGHHSRQG